MSIGRLSGATAAAVIAGFAAWLFGVDAVFSSAWGVLVGAVMLAATTKPHAGTAAWPPPRTERATPVSAVARLAWAVNVPADIARPFATRRVRALAAEWLDDRGLTLGAPTDAAAVDALLGAGAGQTLLGADARLSDLRRILTVITDIPKDDHADT